MQSLNIFRYHSINCAVCGLLIRTVLPSLSTSMPPSDHRMGPAVEIESRFWLMGIPTGCPIFFSSLPVT